jgi:hypothetical protein
VKATSVLLALSLAACGSSPPPPVLSSEELARTEGVPDTARNPLDGPFESFQQAPSPHEAQISPLQEGGPGGPFLAVVLLEYVDPQAPTDRSCAVAIRTEAGWWRTSLFGCSHRDDRSWSQIEALSIDVTGGDGAEAGSPEAKVWFRQDVHWVVPETKGSAEEEHRTYVIVCSIADGKPACADRDEQPYQAR